jgi:hypothetical protein
MERADAIEELEVSFRQLREQGMTEARHKHMLGLLDILREQRAEEFYWLNLFNMHEVGGPFPSIHAASVDAQKTFEGMDVPLRVLSGMLIILRVVKQLKADVAIEWKDVTP